MVWVNQHSTQNYITVSDKTPFPYNEVTGYFIPTLLTYGFKEKADVFAKGLVECQSADGSWTAHRNQGNDNNAYVFDVAQIIDGLSEYKELYSVQLQKAVEWVFKNLQTATYYPDDGKVHSYVRVLYALQKAGCDSGWLKEHLYSDKVYQFNVLSHFYGYAFEGCARLGFDCKPFIDEVKKYNGMVPERPGLSSFCFVGLAQIALSLFLVGEYELGMKILNNLPVFQSQNGGFYGSNGKYFPKEQISWAPKFYLDAFWEAQRLWFVNNLHIFPYKLENAAEDVRFKYLQRYVHPNQKVLDVGCGKGRYINELDCDRYACDIADASKYVSAKFSVGSCLRLPYADQTFDVVFCNEVLEHAIFVDNAIRECLRVLKPEGQLIVIDKDKAYGKDELHFGEEWLDFKELEKDYKAEITQLNQDNLAYPFFAARIVKQ